LQTQTIRLQVLPYENFTPAAARERIVKALPPTAKMVRYNDSQTLKAKASSGKFFDWVQEQVRDPQAPSKAANPPNQNHKAD
jgi:hypothetical protein